MQGVRHVAYHRAYIFPFLGRFRIKHICQRLSIPAKQTIERSGKRILDCGRKLDEPLNLIFGVASALLYILKKVEQQFSTKHPTKQRKGEENDDQNAKVLMRCINER
ncbi:hypothetical protein GQX74_001130 [Glossina fuscipes]|nr:hypothetical protein GQX74_001130 [Glossina fuscipes]